MFHSGYFVAVDNDFFNPMLKFGMIIQLFYMLFLNLDATLYNYKLLSKNI